MKKTKHESKNCCTAELCILRNERNATGDFLYGFDLWTMTVPSCHFLMKLLCKLMDFRLGRGATGFLSSWYRTLSLPGLSGRRLQMTTHFQPVPRYSRRTLILPLHKFTLTSYAIKRSGQSRPLHYVFVLGTS
jgi:hypothetical protein